MLPPSALFIDFPSAPLHNTAVMVEKVIEDQADCSDVA
jgi:hypothetical protein